MDVTYMFACPFVYVSQYVTYMFAHARSSFLLSSPSCLTGGGRAECGVIKSTYKTLCSLDAVSTLHAVSTLGELSVVFWYTLTPGA